MSDEQRWRTLSGRVVVVDFAKSVIAVLPGVLAIAVFGVAPTLEALWPFAAIAAWGVLSAIADIVRWLFTRYRITPTEIERRTGLLVRRHRSVRRDRIRSVDSHAKLRHRIAGLRVVTIGAGQQAAAGEAAFLLDALTRADAEQLRAELLRECPAADVAVDPAAQNADSADAADSAGAAELPQRVEVLARFRPWWVVYNMFSVWAYLMAIGLLWGAFWLGQTFGLDLIELTGRVIDWEGIGWQGALLVGLVGGGLIGAVGMGLNFFTSYWRFELARVRSAEGGFLRTRRGLFSTREINRDELRVRGISVGEPLLWRWMRMADTNVITTGLSIWDMEVPTAILPRGPRSVALAAATRVLGEDPCPIETPLPRHPPAALRRRLWWATAIAAVPVVAVAVPVATAAVPPWVLWLALGVWPVALLAAVVAYRALGHAIAGDYLVVRAGLLSRTTSALRRDAVSTIAVRQSVLQRRLGLSTVSAMTAAGWSIYEAPDVAAADAVPFAAAAAPGLIDEFLVAPAEPARA